MMPKSKGNSGDSSGTREIRERVPNDANTPAWILGRVRLVASIGLDPCSNPWSEVGARVEWSQDHGADGLALPWGGYGLVFVNPPYSRGELRVWAFKIAAEAALGTEIVALTPADSRTGWTRILYSAGGECLHMRTPVRFGGHAWTAPRPHALWYFGPRRAAFRQAFDGHGYWLESNAVSHATQSQLFDEGEQGK